MKLTFIRTWHERVFLPQALRLVRERDTRYRFLGGALITGASIGSLALSLPLAFLWSHDIFDFDFVADHFVSTFTTIVLIVAIGFFALYFVFAGLLLPKADDATTQRRQLVHTSVSVVIWASLALVIFLLLHLVFDAYRYEQAANLTVATSALVVAFLFGARWIVSDPVSSNYCTALFAVISVGLVIAFPYHASGIYQALALRPFGISGTTVRVTQGGQTLDSCLILLSHNYIWLREANEVIVMSREHATLSKVVTGDRRAQECATIQVLRERA